MTRCSFRRRGRRIGNTSIGTVRRGVFQINIDAAMDAFGNKDLFEVPPIMDVDTARFVEGGFAMLIH